MIINIMKILILFQKHNYNISTQQQVDKIDTRCLKNSLADWVALKVCIMMKNI